MPKIKNKKKSYAIVAKEKSLNIFGSFPRTRLGYKEAKKHLSKIQKECLEKLFIEKR
jgi:hypothetical protein